MMATEDGRGFDYLFGGRGFEAYSDRALAKLGRLMTSAPSNPPEGRDDPEEGPIPAGYTYLGQFIDHDLVFDETSRLDRLNAPGSFENSAAPRFDLDSVYGRKSAPENPPFEPAPSVLFRLGDRVSTDPRIEGPDLPRVGKRAQIADRRNDETVIISQLHSLLLRFHNVMAGRVAAARPTLTGDALMEDVRRQVCWHYQWIVVHDFLPRIVGQPMVDRVLRVHGPGSAASQRFFDPRARLFMPLEFSGAAYRFGHSMVRPVYRINAAIRRPLLTRNLALNNLENLLGLRPLSSIPQGWGVQWKYFFELGGNPPGQPMQKARRIDPQLVDPLRVLAGIVPDGPLSLAERNLIRGRALGLPSGQQVADAMNLPRIPDKDLIVGPPGARIPINQLDPDFTDNAPLWYYILREAELEHAGNQLGLVGGRVVAETLIGLLAADPSSYLNATPPWKPDSTLAPAGRFGMPDLIRSVVKNL